MLLFQFSYLNNKGWTEGSDASTILELYNGINRNENHFTKGDENVARRFKEICILNEITDFHQGSVTKDT